MDLLMDRDALAAFLQRDFAEVAADFHVERADLDGVDLAPGRGGDADGCCAHGALPAPQAAQVPL